LIRHLRRRKKHVSSKPGPGEEAGPRSVAGEGNLVLLAFFKYEIYNIGNSRGKDGSSFMSKQNMALLSQSEIDTLISFLSTEKDKNGVGSEVLSQDSIDKLINIIKSGSVAEHKFQMHLPIAMTDDEKIIAFFSSADDTYSKTAAYELLFEKKGSQVNICGKNKESGALVPIRPCDIVEASSADEDSWGKCIMPAVFDQVAGFLHLKYTQDTMDEVCAVFAKVMYGKADAKIPKVYLPTEGSAFRNLIAE